MTRLIERAETGKIFTAKFVQMLTPICASSDHSPGGINGIGWSAVGADLKRISPLTGSRDAHRIRRHPPTLNSLALNPVWHGGEYRSLP